MSSLRHHSVAKLESAQGISVTIDDESNPLDPVRCATGAITESVLPSAGDRNMRKGSVGRDHIRLNQDVPRIVDDIIDHLQELGVSDDGCTVVANPLTDRETEPVDIVSS